MSFSNVAKAWGVKSDFPRRMFKNYYIQTDQKALNGNKNLPKKEGCGDTVGMKKIYGITVINDSDFSRGFFTPYSLIVKILCRI